MQFTTLATLFVAAVGINAAAIEKRVDSIPLNIYTGTGCNQGRPITTAFIPTDGSCFGIAPILSGNTDSGLIDDTILKTLPTGCTRKCYQYVRRSVLMKVQLRRSLTSNAQASMSSLTALLDSVVLSALES
jgi:hypothetical protein